MSRGCVKATERSGVPVGLGLDTTSAHCYHGSRFRPPVLVSAPPNIYQPDFFFLSSCGNVHNCKSENMFSKLFSTLLLTRTPSNISLRTSRFAKAVRKKAPRCFEWVTSINRCGDRHYFSRNSMERKRHQGQALRVLASSQPCSLSLSMLHL